MSLYSTVKKWYKKLIPRSTRHAVWRAMPRTFKILRSRLIALLQNTAEHDEIYDNEYYTGLVDPCMTISCEVIAKSIIDAFSPKSVVDVGCGTGLLLLELRKHGISCVGLEYSKSAIDICRQRDLHVIKFDLKNGPSPIHIRADVVISTEVAEHLPESCSDRFVDILCEVADKIVLTACPCGPNLSEDTHIHLNEQPQEYWIRKFQSRSFKYDKNLTEQWVKCWKSQQVAGCYCVGLMVFHRDGMHN
jgi:SAM-dependent methyltransferase